MAVAAVMTQTPPPRIGGGIVPAAELLMVSYGAGNIRRNALSTRKSRLPGATARSPSKNLARLVKDGLVDWRDA